MKRRKEHLVEKRDGRREFLRATKLARSIHLALYEIGVDEDWRAIELATVVLEGLRTRRGGADSGVVLNTHEIADAVQHALVVTGQPAAAVCYGAVQAERARRRGAVATMAPPTVPDGVQGVPGGVPGGAAAGRASDPLDGRWAGEG